MSEPHRVGSLEVAEDLPFQVREWKIQRAGWVVMALVIALALLGLFSTGPLSSAQQETTDGTLSVDYQRFVRHDGRTSVTVEADGSLASEGEIELWISKDWLDAVNVQGIGPQPDEVRDAGDRRIVVYLVDDASATLTVEISGRPQEMWGITGEVGVVDGPSLSFDQLSYP